MLDILPPETLPAAPGTYVLWLRADRPLQITVGRLGSLSVGPGWYAYVGSAHGPGGVRARVARHLRRPKSCHWHIDNLTALLPIVRVWWRDSSVRLECQWAGVFLTAPGVTAPLRGFGSSDCRCEAHLFDVPEAARAAVWLAMDQPTIMEL